MKDLDNPSLQDIGTIYDNQFQNIYEEQQNLLDAQVAQNLGDGYETIKASLESINGMSGKTAPYAMYVLAKMKVMEDNYAPYNLDSLVDIKSDTPKQKEQIKNYLDEMTKLPDLPARPGESEEAHSRRCEEERLKNFNQKFYKPYGEQMIDILQYRYAKTESLSEQEKADTLLPYNSLIEGLSESYNNNFLPNADAMSREGAQTYAAKIQVMSDLTTHEREREANLAEIRANSAAGQIDDAALKQVFAGAVQRKHDTLRSVSELKNIDKTPDADQAAKRSAYEQETKALTDAFGKLDLNSNGLISLLTDQEKLTLALDPELQSKADLATYKTVGANGELESHVELHIGDIDLQVETPKDQVNPEKLAELRSTIAEARTRQQIASNLDMKEFNADTLKQNTAGLKAAEDLLSERTHFYNSSSNYRDMQNSLEAVRKYSEKLSKAGTFPTVEQHQKMTELTEAAQKATEKYLAGKTGPAKNDYEAKRISAAKVVLGTLNAEKKALDRTKELHEYQAESRKMIGLLQDKIEGFQMTEKQIAACSSPERFALHKKAAAAMDNVQKLKSWKTEKNQDIKEAAPYSRILASVLSTEDNPVMKKENRKILQILSGDSMVEKYAQEKLYTYIMKRSNELETDKLNLDKAPLKDAVDYSIAHINDCIAGFDMNHAQAGLGDLGMELKPESTARFNNYTNHLVNTAGFGQNLLKLMADPIASALPFDTVDPVNMMSFFSDVSGNPKEYNLSGKEINAIGCVPSVQRIMTAIKYEPDKASVSDITLDDFNGSVTKKMAIQSVKQKKAAANERTMAAQQDKAPQNGHARAEKEMPSARLKREAFRGMQ